MIRFVENKIIPFTISIVLTVVSIILLFTIGLKPNIEFSGGSSLEVAFTKQRPTTEEMRAAIQPVNLGNPVIQTVNSDAYLIKTRYITEDEHQKILSALREKFETKEQDGNKVLEKRIETIGPAISSYLRTRAWQAGIFVNLAIILFIAYSFRRVSRPVESWKYGITAVIALFHDVLITMGVFVILGRFFDVEVGISFVVALLTILGYSVNDTIVVYDRIREKLVKRGADKFGETVNLGINETMSRSINTTLITMIVLTCLFIFGGESIKYFALTLIIGVLLGTYSSVFIASPLLVVWNDYKNRHRS